MTDSKVKGERLDAEAIERFEMRLQSEIEGALSAMHYQLDEHERPVTRSEAAEAAYLLLGEIQKGAAFRLAFPQATVDSFEYIQNKLVAVAKGRG